MVRDAAVSLRSLNVLAYRPIQYAFASVIDSALPVPPERTHLMLGSKAEWVSLCLGEKDQQFDKYPEESIAQWHRRVGVVE